MSKSRNPEVSRHTHFVLRRLPAPEADQLSLSSAR